MLATVRIARHPIHPMLIPLPIGMWIFSLASDIALLITNNGMWSVLAYYSMAGGIIGALLAALPGFIDLFTMKHSPARKIGLWHMSINLLIVVLYVVNMIWRVSSMIGPGQIALSVLAVLLLGVSGWLGGEMVYVHGTAVDSGGMAASAAEEWAGGKRVNW